MEEDQEKMAALKRAYADIILNMAKESAARVLASESKAIRVQQELVLTKEEAVSTLLRVKGIMDSKIIEAERVSLCQMRRIQELETQLAEAKSTIKHLNNKLQVASDELASMKSNHTEFLGEQSASKSHLTVHRSIGQKSLAQGTVDGQCCLLFNNVSQEGRSEDNFVGDTDLVSIIMRSKEPELYRNGCTQRIRAFEQNLLTGNAPPGQTDDQLSKNKCYVYEKETTEGPFVENSLETDNMLTRSNDTNGSNAVIQHGDNHERGQAKLFQSKMNRNKHLSVNKGNGANLAMNYKPSEAPLVNISVGAEVTGNGETMPKANNEASQKDTDIHHAPESNGSCRDSEDGGSHFELSIEDRPGSLKSQNRVHVDSMTGRHLNSDRRVYQSALSNVENIEHENIVRTPQLFSKIDTSSGALSEGSIKIDGDSKLIPKENSIGAPSLGVSDRILKYTFTRKRKRGSSTSCNENVLPERKNTPKRRFGDKESALPEPQKPALLTGSSRDSRRLAQVARQLISLSEKRW